MHLFALSRRRAAISAATAILLVSGIQALAQEKSMPTIQVVGEGAVGAQPDMAVVTVGVVSQAPQAADALLENSTNMAAVIAVAKEAGIEARDIRTSQVSLRPQYSYPTQGRREAAKVVAYEASNNVAVRVRDLAKLGGLLDRLVASGANQVRGIELTFAEPGPLRDKARIAAVKDATRKAEILADAAGVKIVRLFSAVEDFSDLPRPMMRMAVDAAESRSPVPVEAGEQEIRGRVTAVFEIAPK